MYVKQKEVLLYSAVLNCSINAKVLFCESFLDVMAAEVGGWCSWGGGGECTNVQVVANLQQLLYK